MNKQKYIVLFAVVLLTAMTASALVALKSREKLGDPGVKVGVGELQLPDKSVAITNRVDLPHSFAGYTSQLTPVSEIELNGLPKDTTFGRRVYFAPDGFASLISVVLMGQDRSSIHTPYYCLAGQGWTIEKEEGTSIRIRGAHDYDLPVHKMILSRQFERNGRKVKMSGIFIYWFVADKKVYGGERLWNMSWDVLRTGVLDRWAYVANLSTCEPGNEEETFKRMEEFLGAAVPLFQTAAGPQLPETVSTGPK